MADVKTKDFNEYLLENVKAAREETREFKNDISYRCAVFYFESLKMR